MKNYFQDCAMRLFRSTAYRLLGFVTKKANNYLEFYIGENRERKLGPISAYFDTTNGRKLPIYEDYRYSIKPGWMFYRTLQALHMMDVKGYTSSREKDFLHQARGTRTLQKTLDEIYLAVKLFAFKHPDLFFARSLEPAFDPIMIPSQDEINSKISHFKKAHELLLAQLRSFGVDVRFKRGTRLLEIGFSSGGYSLFAFEKFRLKVFGIDSFYGNDVYEFPLPDFIRDEIGSIVEFVCGDISKKTQFNDNYFDIVYSSSVLEHVNDLAGAFKEMYRILKPGGLIIHGYHPFFCPNGGHALGITDSPWGHVRMNQEDYLRYIGELRPYEADTAKKWIKSNLNFISINQMQKHIVNQGFKILFWHQKAAPEEQLSDLTPEIMSECFNTYQNISLMDLIAKGVLFAAQKG